MRLREIWLPSRTALATHLGGEFLRTRVGQAALWARYGRQNRFLRRQRETLGKPGRDTVTRSSEGDGSGRPYYIFAALGATQRQREVNEVLPTTSFRKRPMIWTACGSVEERNRNRQKMPMLNQFNKQKKKNLVLTAQFRGGRRGRHFQSGDSSKT